MYVLNTYDLACVANLTYTEDPTLQESGSFTFNSDYTSDGLYEGEIVCGYFNGDIVTCEIITEITETGFKTVYYSYNFDGTW